MTQRDAMAVQAPMATVTDSWTADEQDKALIAQMCQRLGYDPAQVTGLSFTAGTRVGGATGITVEVTRRTV